MTKTIFNKSKKRKLPVSDTISEAFIKQLLLREEGVNLDFKSEMYKIYCGNIEGEKRHKGELIKDILALANRNVGYVGDTSYLIIGVGNQQDEDGNRELYNITNRLPEQKDLLTLINSHCDPPVEDLFCQSILIDNNTLWVLKIPPTRYLHETTKELWCKAVQGSDSDIRKKKQDGDARYSIRTAFIRSGESIRIATMKERVAIEKAKEKYFQEKKGISPVFFGILLGVLVGSPMLTNIGSLLGYNPTSMFFFGFILFGIFGGIMGHYINEFQNIWLDYHKYNAKQKLALIIISVIVIAIILFIYGRKALGY